MTSKTKPTTHLDEQSILTSFFTEVGIIQQLSSNAIRPLLPAGLSIAQYGVLNHFARRGGTETPAQLAFAFQVTKGAMTNTLQRLETQQFIKVETDPADARRKLVSITKKGLNAHTKTAKALAPSFVQMMQGLDLKMLAAALPALQAVRLYLDDARNSKAT
ncbi:MAG: MarR family transcriptional regulator [Parvibaculum sp.]